MWMIGEGIAVVRVKEKTAFETRTEIANPAVRNFVLVTTGLTLGTDRLSIAGHAVVPLTTVKAATTAGRGRRDDDVIQSKSSDYCIVVTAI